MAYSDDQLNEIYNRTGGYCHLCRKKLAFTNYASFGKRGAWEVEHSKAKANGGTDRANNLFPACISCNRGKGARSTGSVRGEQGYQRAPMSREQRTEARTSSTWGLGSLGALVGSTAGPWGALLGGAIGASIGRSIKVKNHP